MLGAPGHCQQDTLAFHGAPPVLPSMGSMAAVAATLQRTGLTNEPGCHFSLVMGAVQTQPLSTEPRKAL